MSKTDDEIPTTIVEESFLDKLEKELLKRGGGGGRGNNDEDKGKPDRPDGPDLIRALIICAVTAITLALVARSKPKTKNI